MIITPSLFGPSFQTSRNELLEYGYWTYSTRSSSTVDYFYYIYDKIGQTDTSNWYIWCYLIFCVIALTTWFCCVNNWCQQSALTLDGAFRELQIFGRFWCTWHIFPIYEKCTKCYNAALMRSAYCDFVLICWWPAHHSKNPIFRHGLTPPPPKKR